MRPPNKGFIMFKNKGFFVKVVPDPQSSEEPVDRPRTDFRRIYNETVNGATKMMAVYILADTIRKVAVHTAETKIR